MILYNVTIKIDKEIEGEWKKWMFDDHVPKVMATGFFSSYRFCKILHDEPDGETYAIQYLAPNYESFIEYAEGPAPALQAEYLERYKDQFIAIRTLMRVEEEFIKES